MSFQDLMFSETIRYFRRLNETDLNNTALVNVYFGKQDGVLYRRDVLYKWYEILGRFASCD